MDYNDYQVQEPVQPPVTEAPPRKNRWILWFFLGLAGGLLVSCIFMTILITVAARSGLLINLTGGATAESITDESVINKLDRITYMIDSYFYNDVSTEDLIDGMYHGVVEALGDKYSVYYNEEEWEQVNSDLSGIYYGIGSYVAIDETTNYTCLTKIIKGTPAEAAGLLDGDLLYSVDGTETYGVELDAVVSMIRGEEGTSVHLQIIREGEEDLLEFDVMRAKVETPTVTYEMMEDQIAYIEISAFDSVTAQQFKTAFEQAKEDGMKGLIIDIRNNGGGYLDVVVDVLRNFMPEGVIVYTIDKYGYREDYNCSGGSELDVPMVVLVNQYSASASEIFAGAVRDYEIGTLVGTTTFGKGIVQTILNLGDDTYVKLTTSSYYTPSGECIHGVGIKPDVEVEYDSELYRTEGTDNQLQRAIEIMKEKLAE